jgi:hypothetical protein
LIVEKWTLLHSCPLFHNHDDHDDGTLSSVPSKDKYIRPISLGSLVSIKKALIKHKQAAWLGKILTTRVRRLISLLRR